MESLRADLPTTFRFTGSRSFVPLSFLLRSYRPTTDWFEWI
jgi:hypothetical protein